MFKPANKSALTAVLTYHVVAGKINAVTLMDWIKKNNGAYGAKTIQGGELKFTLDKNNNIWLWDEGNKAQITVKNVYQKNGIIYVIDTVVLPKM